MFTSSVILDTFQVLNCSIWLVATVGLSSSNIMSASSLFSLHYSLFMLYLSVTSSQSPQYSIEMLSFLLNSCLPHSSLLPSEPPFNVILIILYQFMYVFLLLDLRVYTLLFLEFSWPNTDLECMCIVIQWTFVYSLNDCNFNKEIKTLGC